MKLGLDSFGHGVFPEEHKELTEHLSIERMPFAKTFVIPLSQHAGKPAKAIVKKGDSVRRGEIIAVPDGFVSTTLHSPVAGTVVAIAERRHPNGSLMPSIEIEADPFATQAYEPKPPIDWRSLSRDNFVKHVQRCGLVGMGGAAFPSHVKFALPDGRRVRTLVVNGCECEPYLTCDHRVMLEEADSVIRGIVILAHHLGVERTSIGVEMNKPDAIAALRASIHEQGEGERIEVRPLRVKYPQGAEKMLIKALYGVEVPAGKLPLDVEIVVNNVGTMLSLDQYFRTGFPLIERVITVSGPIVRRPTNLTVPVGTSVREVLEHCGGLTAETREVIMGGPMMGMSLSSIDVPILKGTSGILAFPEAYTERPDEYPCIRCGRCLEACPIYLNPSRLGRLVRAQRFDEADGYHALDCMECGCCSFSCPSNIPLVQLIRVGKREIRKQQARVKANGKAGA